MKKNIFEKTWRWFGKKDRITLKMLRQIGVEGIVTALHSIPNGHVWSYEDICEMRDHIESYGMRWSVVESLPVSETIKYGGPDRDMIIDNYITSLENLGKAGIKCVCYNFMPVIDWIRTELQQSNEDGSYTLFFDKVKFGYFDIYILERESAREEYSTAELEKIDSLATVITQEEIEALIYTIIIKTQGFINGNISEGDINPVAIFKSLLAKYKGITRDELRQNLKYFLERVTPTAQKYGIGLCVHPDDPPFQVLGLPRIVTSRDDIKWILDSVDTPANGLTFCAGSLSSGAHNDVVALAKEFAPRTHFVHLRSTDVFENGDFIEADHNGGRANIIELIEIFAKTNPSLPMRVDHGRLLSDDIGKGDNPGYSFLGRMYALAQVTGMMNVIEKKLL